MDQSNRYARLDLNEADLIADGKHVLCAYVMRPKNNADFLSTAAHFAAESSTGTNVEVGTTDDFTRGIDALVYEIDPAHEVMKIAYPLELFDRNITDGKAMVASFLTLTVGNNQGMGDVEYGKLHDFYFPPAFLALFDGPNRNIADMWRVLGNDYIGRAISRNQLERIRSDGEFNRVRHIPGSIHIPGIVQRYRHATIRPHSAEPFCPFELGLLSRHIHAE